MAIKQQLRAFAQTLTMTALLAVSVTGQAMSEDKLEQTIASKHRTAAFAERDQYRHPYQTLSFFGLKEDMSVVELSPGGGWYTEILAPYLKEKGQYIAAGFDPQSETEYYRKSAKALADKLAAQPEIYGKTQNTIFQPPSQLEFAPANSVDMVLSFRNAHHWHRKGDAANIYAQIFKSLKSGGIFGIVQHRASDTQPTDSSGNKGYLKEADVIKMVEAAGFKLQEKSEINANSKDSKDYEEGVWALPPTLGAKEENHAKLKAIGESDRMTLKFIKP